jgi:hypothetical protein
MALYNTKNHSSLPHYLSVNFLIWLQKCTFTAKISPSPWYLSQFLICTIQKLGKQLQQPYSWRYFTTSQFCTMHNCILGIPLFPPSHFFSSFLVSSHGILVAKYSNMHFQGHSSPYILELSVQSSQNISLIHWTQVWIFFGIGPCIHSLLEDNWFNSSQDFMMPSDSTPLVFLECRKGLEPSVETNKQTKGHTKISTL